MIKVEVYANADEAVSKLSELVNNVSNMITEVNTKIELVKSKGFVMVSNNIVHVKTYSITNQNGEEIYKLSVIGSIDDADEESLNLLRNYYINLRNVLISLIEAIDKIKMGLTKPLAIVYMGEAPVLLIHSINDKNFKMVNDIKELLSKA